MSGTGRRRRELPGNARPHYRMLGQSDRAHRSGSVACRPLGGTTGDREGDRCRRRERPLGDVPAAACLYGAQTGDLRISNRPDRRDRAAELRCDYLDEAACSYPSGCLGRHAGHRRHFPALARRHRLRVRTRSPPPVGIRRSSARCTTCSGTGGRWSTSPRTTECGPPPATRSPGAGWTTRRTCGRWSCPDVRGVHTRSPDSSFARGTS